MLKNIKLKIPSTYLNILNFLIFDVALITLVYLLTEDVMGRMNNRALRDGKPHRLFMICPPVLDGGLCTTNRRLAHFLLLARLIWLGLALSSGLAIKRNSRPEYFYANGSVLLRGNISSVEERLFLRSGCQDYRPGTVRAEGVSKLECITDRALFAEPIFE